MLFNLFASSENFPKRENLLVSDFSSFENFFPITSLCKKGIKESIHIIYVSFNYNGVEIDLNFPNGEDMNHFTFTIEENGLYRPTFQKDAMKIENQHLPYFEETRKKYSLSKPKKIKLKMPNKPRWLQNDATPVNSIGEKFEFICQFEAETFSVDDSWIYVFYNEKDRQVKYIHQRT